MTARGWINEEWRRKGGRVEWIGMALGYRGRYSGCLSPLDSNVELLALSDTLSPSLSLCLLSGLWDVVPLRRYGVRNCASVAVARVAAEASRGGAQGLNSSGWSCVSGYCVRVQPLATTGPWMRGGLIGYWGSTQMARRYERLGRMG